MSHRSRQSRAKPTSKIPEFIQKASDGLKGVQLGPETRELLGQEDIVKLYMESVTHIRFPVFLHDLWAVFASFLRVYGTRLNHCMFYDPSLGNAKMVKSTTWLNMLFQNFYRRCTEGAPMKMKRVGRKELFHALEPSVYNKSNATSSYKSAAPRDTLVYIDDMIYSGTQIASIIQKAIKIPGLKKIIVLVPYIGGGAYATIWNSIKYQHSKLTTRPDVEVELMHVKKFDTFQKMLDRKKPGMQYPNPDHVPVFFDHKVPDDVSTWESLLCSYVDCSIPFYKRLKWDDMVSQERNLSVEPLTLEDKQYLASRNVMVSSLGRREAFERGDFDDLISTDKTPYFTPAVDFLPSAMTRIPMSRLETVPSTRPTFGLSLSRTGTQTRTLTGGGGVALASRSSAKRCPLRSSSRRPSSRKASMCTST